VKQLIQIFKSLGNVSRVRIIKLLSDGVERTVSQIGREIHVTFKGTSRHLNLLYALDILKSEGKGGHVFYSLNQNMPRDARKVIDLVVKP
jgi:DNA-binding transcriptional ArsR family regulator